MNKINGKIYIGQTIKSLRERCNGHMYDAFNLHKGHCRYFGNAIRKYGKENFVWEIVEYCNSKEELNLAEEWYIRYYKTFVGLDGCCGYNLTLGGEGPIGYIHTEEARAKISNAGKGSTRRVGKYHTEETKIKMSESKLGKKRSPFSNKHKERIGRANRGKKRSKKSLEKVSQSRRKKYVVTFPSGKEVIICGIIRFCSNYHYEKLNAGHLCGCATGRCNHHKKYKCRYYDSDNDKNISYWEGNYGPSR